MKSFFVKKKDGRSRPESAGKLPNGKTDKCDKWRATSGRPYTKTFCAVLP
ncbi:hypothetical protein [uncultured Ruminococcus sp.]|nr:hypothetical protein [uncultured Ruminococcus sp.]